MTFPSSPRRAAGYRLVLVARRWRHAIDQELHAAGLTDATWRPLFHLYRLDDGVRQKDLAASLGMDGSSVVRLLDVLAERGLLERRDDPADGRAKSLHLTADGHRMVEKVCKLVEVFEDRMLDGLSDKEIAQMLDFFDRIEANLGADA